MKIILFLALVAVCGYYFLSDNQPDNNASIDSIDLAKFPVTAQQILDFATTKKDNLCLQKADMNDQSELYQRCLARAQSFTYMCHNRIIKDMPDYIDNNDEFNKFSDRMMQCIVPVS
jgi:hypothetical protein